MEGILNRMDKTALAEVMGARARGFREVSSRTERAADGSRELRHFRGVGSGASVWSP